MSDFPTIVTTNGDPASTDHLNSPSHSQEHQSHNAEIKAVQTKVGTGAATPSTASGAGNGKVLRASGTGASTWGAIDISRDILAFASASLITVLTDETGTGALVFGTQPALDRPAVTSPWVTTAIDDANGNEAIRIPATGSAVNDITVTNAAASGTPDISASGDDTNIDLSITPKGTGNVFFKKRFDGWVSGLTVPSSVTYNGNRSYNLAYASSILGYKSPGMRNKYTRTVAAPTQVTALSGTKYWSKATPNKFSFTDDFVIDVVINPTSYVLGTIVSVYNGTSGWALRMNATGQIQMIGYNAGAANFSQNLSYQAVPLNKETRITGQLDMSTFTNAATTSYMMFDGVQVPSLVSRGGTNPISLIQAGNLNVGAENGGTNPFQGNISQLAIFNAKVTQATIITYHGQTYAGSETSFASGYSFNGVATDLNTTTPNDLTAQNSATYATGGAFGNKGASSTLEYCITTVISADGLTETVQVPEGCSLPTSGGVSLLSYAAIGIPLGFPSQSDRWDFTYIQGASGSANTSASYAQQTGLQMVIAAGAWELIPSLVISTVAGDGYMALSTSTTSVNDSFLVIRCYNSAGSNEIKPFIMEHGIQLTTATTYYIIGNKGVATSVTSRGVADDATGPYTKVIARFSYL